METKSITTFYEDTSSDTSSTSSTPDFRSQLKDSSDISITEEILL